MFYFFYEIIIYHLNKKRKLDDIRSTYAYFNFFNKTVNSHNLETANQVAQVVFLLHNAMKTNS